MSSGIEAFKQKFGSPNPAATPIHFSATWAQGLWQYFVDQAGAGYFLHGFVYLFGAEANDLNPLLAHWHFLFETEVERMVIGRNAYGALLVLENPDQDATRGKVGLLDPLTVSYFTDPNLTFVSLQARWLPLDLLPRFLDDSVYRTWRTTDPATLAFDQLLAIKQPLSLGGKMDLENFQVENIFDYYRSTGEVYAKHPGHGGKKA
ncbi:hypothetical protein QWY85_13580 [Neolewinella lacunae]|uniref:Uncharacterized protein n=1 Tax=Neolewinella lacunae TaxID=1517758 RepID=A0A923PL30_9BACT|nr:hypothetical protein [Neolewinella lacunae]MBC6993259.1 hypothetical protein [Neolewinella lacunae]MDN3635694.1 hypothetical protein [Neolewinella lacunae]